MLNQILTLQTTALRPMVSPEDVLHINSLSNPPPFPLLAEDVYVRSCRLAGDAIDAHYGRFHTEHLPQLLALTNGAPALIGHDRFSLPVARFFGGEITEHNGAQYITPRFYWPKAHSKSLDFQTLLDSGIISETSISFTFTEPQCSVCSQDIRGCEHHLGEVYLGTLCHFWYQGLKRVLEGSFVYRGGEPGTAILAHPFDVIKEPPKISPVEAIETLRVFLGSVPVPFKIRKV